MDIKPQELVYAVSTTRVSGWDKEAAIDDDAHLTHPLTQTVLTRAFQPLTRSHCQTE
jgi:hypothetical protein